MTDKPKGAEAEYSRTHSIVAGCRAAGLHDSARDVLDLAYERDQLLADRDALARSDSCLRSAILDVLCSQPPSPIGARLRSAINDARPADAHPEDRCEECRVEFEPWFWDSERWERATGRAWGGPILCESCATRRERERPHLALRDMTKPADPTRPIGYTSCCDVWAATKSLHRMGCPGADRREDALESDVSTPHEIDTPPP